MTATRIQIAVGGLPVGSSYAVVDRTVAPSATYTTVRGGAHVDATSLAILLWDYEFPAGASITYRVRVYNASNVLLATYSSIIVGTLDTIELKSPARPFLNRQVTVIDFSDVAQPQRGAVFEVLGRRLPIAVTEVRGSRRWELVLRAASEAERAALETFFSFGDTVFLHVPPSPASQGVPATGYYAVGDTAQLRPPSAKHDTAVRYFRLPLIEVDAPDPSVVGYTITWLGVQSAWATWALLLADSSVPTWLDLQAYVSAPSDEIVG